MNNEGINNSTESSSGSSQENDHSRVQSGEASGKGKKRHSCSINTKLEAIAYAESNGKEAAARKFRVDAKRIREWCQKKAELETSANPMKRLHSGGRKPLSTELEDRVLEWIHDMRARGQRISIQAGHKQERKTKFGLICFPRIFFPRLFFGCKYKAISTRYKICFTPKSLSFSLKSHMNVPLS